MLYENQIKRLRYTRKTFAEFIGFMTAIIITVSATTGTYQGFVTHHAVICFGFSGVLISAGAIERCDV
jgi:hypothetical protein